MMRHHLETGKSTMKRIWMIAGCVTVMLLAVILLSSTEYSNLGFLALLLCPAMHLFMHRHGHRGKTDQKEEPTLRLATQKHGNRQPQDDRKCIRII